MLSRLDEELEPHDPEQGQPGVTKFLFTNFLVTECCDRKPRTQTEVQRQVLRLPLCEDLDACFAAFFKRRKASLGCEDCETNGVKKAIHKRRLNGLAPYVILNLSRFTATAPHEMRQVECVFPATVVMQKYIDD